MDSVQYKVQPSMLLDGGECLYVRCGTSGYTACTQEMMRDMLRIAFCRTADDEARTPMLCLLDRTTNTMHEGLTFTGWTTDHSTKEEGMSFSQMELGSRHLNPQDISEALIVG